METMKLGQACIVSCSLQIVIYVYGTRSIQSLYIVASSPGLPAISITSIIAGENNLFQRQKP